MDLTGKRFLVIGGAGFIGSHVVEELLRHDVAEVRIYDNFSRGSRENLEEALRDDRTNIFPLGGDVLHQDLLRQAMENIDGVFHLAALWLLHCHDYPRSAFEVNVRGTFNVLEACRDAGGPRLVFSSSASVYGDAVRLPMDEDHPFQNQTFYGATKIAGEQMCRAFHHRYGLNYVGLRYMNVYGARQDYRGAYIAVIMKILDRIDQGLPPIVYGDGSQTYDFIYVQDAARANVCAMAAETVDEFYNVGSGQAVSIRTLAEKILEVTKSDLEVHYEPEGPTFVTHRVGTTEKAARDLSFRAEIPLEEGLRRLIAWRESHKARLARQRENT